MLKTLRTAHLQNYSINMRLDRGNKKKDWEGNNSALCGLKPISKALWCHSLFRRFAEREAICDYRDV
jgi:hypothetical protein